MLLLDMIDQENLKVCVLDWWNQANQILACYWVLSYLITTVKRKEIEKKMRIGGFRKCQT